MTRAAKQSGEFDRIARYFAPLAASHAGAFGLTDDAAVITPASGTELVVTTDTIVAGVHYIGDEPPELIAAKLLRVNLSDLAAMGATPRAYTLNVALPLDIDDRWLEAFAGGLAEDQARFEVTLIGGDSVGTPGPVVLSLTAYGEVPASGAVRRSAARPGDTVYASGTIGDGALGLRAVRGKLSGISETDAAVLIARYRKPEPRLGLLARLAQKTALAAADVSDGLVADLGHITDASDVAMVIRADDVPLSTAARAVLDRDPDSLVMILSGGDDYELVFCAPHADSDVVEAIAKECDVPVTAMGQVEKGAGVRVIRADGSELTLGRTGFTHG